MLILFFIGAALLVLIDQLTKLAVCQFVQGVATIPLIPDVFHFTYHRNTGAAFGIMQGQFGVFFVVTVLVVAAVVAYVLLKRPKSLWLTLSLTLLTGGALGNFVDRLFRGYVVDFLDFRLIYFPIFNGADCFVVCGAILLMAYVVFVEGKETKKAKKEQQEE